MEDPGATESGPSNEATSSEEDEHREQVLAAAQAELDAKLEADESAMHTVRIGDYQPGRTRVEADAAKLPVKEAVSAAKIGDALERDIYEDEKRVETDIAVIGDSDPALAAEAQQVLAEEKKDLDDSMTESVKINVEAQEADKERRHHIGRTMEDVNAALANAAAAEKDLGRESADLADADKAVAKLEADMKAAGIEPPPPPKD